VLRQAEILGLNRRKLNNVTEIERKAKREKIDGDIQKLQIDGALVKNDLQNAKAQR